MGVRILVSFTITVHIEACKIATIIACEFYMHYKITTFVAYARLRIKVRITS